MPGTQLELQILQNLSEDVAFWGPCPACHCQGDVLVGLVSYLAFQGAALFRCKVTRISLAAIKPQ